MDRDDNKIDESIRKHLELLQQLLNEAANCDFDDNNINIKNNAVDIKGLRNLIESKQDSRPEWDGKSN
ncbi:MAG: hypothetical protein WB511_04185 [Nitrososphaeraceae archaeon]